MNVARFLKTKWEWTSLVWVRLPFRNINLEATTKQTKAVRGIGASSSFSLRSRSPCPSPLSQSSQLSQKKPRRPSPSAEPAEYGWGQASHWLLRSSRQPSFPRSLPRSRIRLSSEEGRRAVRRLALEINQAGLSWLTILKKRKNFGVAFHQFDPDRVAAYRKRERARLLRDAGIIRNRLKINAVIENARRILELRQTHGSFRVAGCTSPAAQAGMGEAVQEDLLVYWWGDNRRVSFEHRLPARRSRARLSGLQTHRASKATVGAILVCTSDSLFIRLLKHSWGQASHHPDMSAIADARPWRDLTHRLSWKPSSSRAVA